MVLANAVIDMTSGTAVLYVAFPKPQLLQFESMTSRFLSPLIAVALFALGACGGERASSASAPTGVDLEVRAIDGIVWNANDYAATATDGALTIFGANDSSLPHNLHVLDKDGKDVGKALDLASPGSSGTLQVTVAPGEYRIVCLIPGHTNMDSKLVVS